MELVDTLDDSLIVDIRKGKRRTSTTTPYSVSSLLQFEENPHRYFLQRVRQEREPQNINLMMGSALHAGFEAFYEHATERVAHAVRAFRAYVEKEWDNVADKTERYNPDTPHFGYDKQEFQATKASTIERGVKMLVPFCAMLDQGWDAYTPTRLMRPVSEMTLPDAGVERRLGDVAAGRGLPYTEMNLFDPQIGKMVKDLKVAIVGGVPIQGFIDLIMQWEDGSPATIDHKGVTHVVSYYGPHRPFAPSYDPATDFQLDVYNVATGITRSGFQFITKQPQFVPDSGILHSGWMDEKAWKVSENGATHLPMALTPGPDGEHYYIMVWRPAPQDHPSRPNLYTPEQLLPRVYQRLRTLTEQITISNLLYEAGVDPEIAFPAGNPKALAKKSCPYCFYRKAGLCKTPRTSDPSSMQAFQEAIQTRSALIPQLPEIQERIQLWTAQHAAFYTQ